MKIALHGLLVFCSVFFFTAVSGKDLVLATRGRPADRVIVIPAGAPPAQKYAAEELRDWTERLTGVRMSIVSDAEPLPARAVLVGLLRHTTALCNGKNPDLSALGSDGFELRVCSPHLLILASSERGVLYGVYEILERFGGCRWYASRQTLVPHLTCLAVPETLCGTHIPAFKMREPFWFDVLEHPAFAARLRVNSLSWRTMDPKFGGDPYRFGGGLGSCHTFNTLMPPEEWFDSHPEYFSLVNGRRLKERTQLCLTNPDVLRIVTSNVLMRIRQDPGAKFYGVSQNDWYNYCECPACAAIDAEEESHAGTMIRFVNAVAAAVEKEFPNVIIETLAYQYTRKPPKKTRLRHNVVPCLCTIECDFTRPIDKSRFAQNQRFVDDIRGWSAQTDSLYVWDYTTNFRHYPQVFPNIFALQDNIRFFRRNNVKELFEQGAYQGRHADFAELKAWLLAKWMWDPELPIEPLLDDFFRGYYGAAAPYARAAFNILHRASFIRAEKMDVSARIFDDLDIPTLPADALDRAAEQWTRAAAAVVDDPPRAYNVRMSAFSVDYTLLERYLREKDCLLRFVPVSTEESERFTAAQARARSLLARLDEAGDIRLCESKDNHDAGIRSWRTFISRPLLSACASSTGTVMNTELRLAQPGVWGARVTDPSASEGHAVKLFNTHYEWCLTFPLNRVIVPPNARLKIRARIRVDAAPNARGEAFWAGVYDPEAKTGRGQIQPRVEACGKGYVWYDVCEWTPHTKDWFWIGPGRFDKKNGQSSIRAVFIDKLEISVLPPAQ